MRRKTYGTIVFSVIALTAISSIIFIKTSLANVGSSPADNINHHDFTYIPPTLEESAVNGPNQMTQPGADVPDATFVPATKMDLDPESLTVYVNKEFALPKDYKPTDLVQVNIKFNLKAYDERTYMREEAAKALEELFEAAEEDGYIIYGVSGYRSYERQRKIFINNIIKRGKEHTLRYSAVPGTSEHQTGLAIDVSTKALNFRLTSDFANSKEGIWLAEHAHNYGYIIRYPEGKAEITGYYYEPWHIRYVGKALANYLYNNQLTLDEYYKYAPSKDFDFEEKYASLINYTPPRATPVPEEEDDVVLGENGEIIDGGAEEDASVDVSDPDEDKKNDDKNKDTSEDTITDAPDQPTAVPEEEEDDSSNDDGAENEEEDSSTEEEPDTGENAVTPVPTPMANDDETQAITPSPTMIPAQ